MIGAATTGVAMTGDVMTRDVMTGAATIGGCHDRGGPRRRRARPDRPTPPSVAANGPGLDKTAPADTGWTAGATCTAATIGNALLLGAGGNAGGGAPPLCPPDGGGGGWRRARRDGDADGGRRPGRGRPVRHVGERVRPGEPRGRGVGERSVRNFSVSVPCDTPDASVAVSASPARSVSFASTPVATGDRQRHAHTRRVAVGHAHRRRIGHGDRNRRRGAGLAVGQVAHRIASVGHGEGEAVRPQVTGRRRIGERVRSARHGGQRAMRRWVVMV